MRRETWVGGLVILIILWGLPSWAAPAPHPWGPMKDIEASARREGRLVIYVGAGYTTREAEKEIAGIFRDRYGVTIDWTSMSGIEIPTRVLAESRTQPVADVIMVGLTGRYSPLRERGLVSPILAPSSLEKNIWRLDPASYTSQTRDWLHTKFAVSPTFLINTNLVRPDEEPKGYKDLLDPKWKGQIVVMTPAVGGSGSGWFDATHRILGLDYMKALAKQVVLVRENNEPPDSVARGQYAIAIGAIVQRALPLIREGAPLKYVHPREGSYFTQAGISLLSNGPHPNAAKLYLQWFYTREGQSVFGRTAGVISLRRDVPQDYLPEFLRYRDGTPFIVPELQDLVEAERTAELRTLAKQIFEEKK